MANPNPAPKAPEQAQSDARLARPDRDDPHSDSRGGDREFTNRDWEQANAPMDPERKRRFKELWTSTHLPNLPHKDGWHRCWVSTSHALDTVPRRIALGYRVIQIDELKTQGWTPEQASVKDGGSADGTVRWREMVGMEIPQDQYLDYMRFFHHEQPREMAASIYGGLEQAASEVRERGGRIDIGDGFGEMARHRRAPAQFE